MIFFLIVVVQNVFGSSDLVVQTSTGAIRGKLERVLDKSIYSFRGIPYATPPVGELRFKEPEPIAPWEGVYDATEKSVSCIQYKAAPLPWIADPPYTENCLLLNVWTPKVNEASNRPLRTVMVWIHGGGAYSGSSNLDVHDGKVLAAVGDVVVASMNYRFGVFGFLNANSTDAPGNMGMLDQILAMKWIKNNAKVFGGNPKKITILGQSFGSISVGLHLLSPLSRGLFSRAVMQAANPYHPSLQGDSQTVATLKGNELASRVGCSSDEKTLMSHPNEVVSCLRETDPYVLAKAESELWVDNIIWSFTSYGDSFMPTSPITAVREGKFNCAEVITGLNSNEGSLFINMTVPELFASDELPELSISQGRDVFQKLFTATGFIPDEKGDFSSTAVKVAFPSTDEIADRYLKDVNEADPHGVMKAIFKGYNDFLMFCPTVLFAERLAVLHNSVYFYVFNHLPSNSPWKPYMATVHFEENQFVFGLPLINPTKYTNEEQKLSRLIMDAWISLAKTGKPHLPKGRHWPVFNGIKQNILEITAKTQKIMKDPQTQHCAFWDENFA